MGGLRGEKEGAVLQLLFDLLKRYQQTMGRGFAMDFYGSGPDAEAVGRKAASMKKRGLFSGALTMKGYADHAALGSYKIFVNPSVTEVLCTTVAEAIAMGKWVICPKHPSNDFFAQFPNCLQYSTPDEFVDAVNWALVHDPPPLLPEVSHEWQQEVVMGFGGRSGGVLLSELG